MPSNRAAILTPSPIRSPSAFLDDVANMNANAELDAALRRKAGVALDHAALYLDGTTHGVDYAAELNDAPSPVRLTMRP